MSCSTAGTLYRRNYDNVKETVEKVHKREFIPKYQALPNDEPNTNVNEQKQAAIQVLNSWKKDGLPVAIVNADYQRITNGMREAEQALPSNPMAKPLLENPTLNFIAGFIFGSAALYLGAEIVKNVK